MTTWGHLALASRAGSRATSSEFFLRGNEQEEGNIQTNAEPKRWRAFKDGAKRKQPSYHLTRNMSSPFRSVEPMMHSGSRSGISWSGSDFWVARLRNAKDTFNYDQRTTLDEFKEHFYCQRWLEAHTNPPLLLSDLKDHLGVKACNGGGKMVMIQCGELLC